ncbi:MAG TPA: TIGR01458 family HAD-type hydrolase, partial [Gemmatimonadales bacterium]|nr:TIGR01458 family HAD-type hydrolase [Gemmatimonadales bacterium]
MRGFLFDLDGTMYTDAGAVPGALETIGALRSRRIPFRFVTNTTGRPRRQLVERLRGYGCEVSADEILTPVRAAVVLCQEQGYRPVAPYVPEATLEDLEGLELVAGTTKRPVGETQPGAVIIGDLGVMWTYELLQEAFGFLLNTTELVALSRDRYWLKGNQLVLDAGPFVVALEYAASCTARVTGKPMKQFYDAAVKSLGLPPDVSPDEIAMVGDDVWSDVRGAQEAGYQGWLVRTGKFRA